MEDKKDVKLSKTILEMKFMKKTKERVEKEEDDAEGREMYSNEITEEMRKTGNIVFIETSLANCKGLVDGRLSFGGMNPEIEKMMEADYYGKVTEIENQKEKEISDVEMAQTQFSSSLVDTMNKKFQAKKNKNKKKFMKPPEDSSLI